MNSSNTNQVSAKWRNLTAKIAFFIWAVGVPFLYWLVHGPWGPLLRYSIIQAGRDLLLQYFKARYVFSNNNN